MCWKSEAIWVWVWVKITKTCFFSRSSKQSDSLGNVYEIPIHFFFRWVQAGNHHALATPVLRPHVSLHAQEALAEKGATRFFLTGFSMQATHLHEIDRYELIDMI